MNVLGRIAAPYGLQGWVKVQVFGDDPQAWAEMDAWWLGRDEALAEEAWQPRQLSACRVHGKGLVARFAGIVERTGAEALVGCYVAAPREALPKTSEGEFYWADLIGLDVVNLAGERLGRVAELIRTGAHEVLDVRDEADASHLMPFVATVIRQVDLAGRRIQVDWERDW